MNGFISLVSGQFTRTLILGTFFPVILFLLLTLLAVEPLLPNGMPLVRTFQTLDAPWEVLAFTLVAVVLTVFLYNLNIPIIRIYEGYPWLESGIGKRRQNRFVKEYCEIRRLIPQLRAIRDGWRKIDPDSVKIDKLQDRLDRLGLRLSLTFPTEAGFILPTAFGNVVRSFETYPSGQYGMDAVTFWPRLAMVVGKDGLSEAEDAKSSVDCFINCSALSAFLAVILFVIGGAVTTPATPAGILIRWPIEMLAALMCPFLFYEGAVAQAAAWGEEVKAVFDIFRWDLLKKMGYQQTPSTREDERSLWQAITKQALYGDPPFTPSLDYKDLNGPRPRTVVSTEPADIRVQLSGGASTNWLGSRSYTYRIANTDDKNRPAAKIELTEVLPPDVEYVWESARLNGRPYEIRGLNPLCFELGPLAAGGAVEVSYSVLPAAVRV